MDLLRSYVSSSDSDSDAEQKPKTAGKRDTPDDLLPVDVKDSVNEPMKKKKKKDLSCGYVSTRCRSTRVSVKQESSGLNTLSTVAHNISEYLSPPQACDKPKHILCELPHNFPYVTFIQHLKPVLALHWHPSDDRLLLSCSLDGTIRLWDALWRKTCIATYAVQDVPLKKVKWVSPTTMVSGGYDNNVFYTDVVCGKIISKLTHKSYVTALALHPEESNSLLTGNSRSEIHRWDLRCGKEVSTYKGAGGQILDILFLNDNQFVASSDIERRSGYSQSMNVWDYVSGVVLATQVYFEPYSCPFLRLHPTKSVFLAQSNASYLISFSSNKPYSINKHKRFEGHSLDGYSVGFDVSPDGRIVCSASSDGRVLFYNYSSTCCLKSVPLTNSSTLSVEWHPRLSSVVAVSNWNGHIFCLR